MDSVSTYSLPLIFYTLVGAVSSPTGAFSESRNSDTYNLAAYQTVSLLLGLVCLRDSGNGVMRDGIPIYAYLLVLVIWFAGSRSGKTILPGD